MSCCLNNITLIIWSLYKDLDQTGLLPSATRAFVLQSVGTYSYMKTEFTLVNCDPQTQISLLFVQSNKVLFTT